MILRLLIRRLLEIVVVVFGVVTVVFVVMHITPGDPTQMMLPDGAPEQAYNQLKAAWDLDKPMYVQYLMFLGKAVRGDLGTSMWRGVPATRVVLERIPMTLQLTLAGILFALVIAVPLGVLAATHQNSAVDFACRLLALFGQSMPPFWLGIMLMLLLAVRMRVFPVSGSGTLGHLVLPTITLGTYLLALTMRVTRSEMLNTLSEDYIRTARAKGLSSRMVLYRHALKNALVPLITVVGLQFGTLVGGAVVTETIFGWPGVGRLAVDSIRLRDYPVVQAIVFYVSILVVMTYLVTDMLYTYVDPRIRLLKR
jgi:peptide/nickel transport system permease protein